MKALTLRNKIGTKEVFLGFDNEKEAWEVLERLQFMFDAEEKFCEEFKMLPTEALPLLMREVEQLQEGQGD